MRFKFRMATQNYLEKYNLEDLIPRSKEEIDFIDSSKENFDEIVLKLNKFHNTLIDIVDSTQKQKKDAEGTTKERWYGALSYARAIEKILEAFRAAFFEYIFHPSIPNSNYSKELVNERDSFLSTLNQLKYHVDGEMHQIKEVAESRAFSKIYKDNYLSAIKTVDSIYNNIMFGEPLSKHQANKK